MRSPLPVDPGLRRLTPVAATGAAAPDAQLDHGTHARLLPRSASADPSA